MSVTLSYEVLSKYKNNIFFETGTLWGGGVDMALRCDFKKIYTCELSSQKIEFNKAKFAKEISENKVVIIEGDTFETFAAAIKTITEPTTFWLDAHWDDGPMGKFRCPLPYELQSLAEHPIKNHTLLIDDRRLFGANGHTWGGEITEDQIINLIKKINPEYKISYENGFIPDDIIVARI